MERGQVFMVVEEKRRGSAVCAFPDRAAAKPGGQTARLRLLFGFWFSRNKNNHALMSLSAAMHCCSSSKESSGRLDVEQADA
jgi:hypothetical protein